jgi:hypothetical protein
MSEPIDKPEDNQFASETPASTNPSNVPNDFQVTRNGVTLTFSKVDAKRVGKGGKALPPTFCPQIPAITKELEQYRAFIGDDIFFADLNSTIYQRYQKQQKDLWSQDRSKFDLETAIESAKLVSIRSETLDDLVEEMKQISSDFLTARNTNDTAKMMELTEALSANLQKQASKKHAGK